MGNDWYIRGRIGLSLHGYTYRQIPWLGRDVSLNLTDYEACPGAYDDQFVLELKKISGRCHGG
jgi:hypothetical protein